MNGTVTLEWSCRDCGNIRRTDCTDVGGAVYVFKPAGWVFGETREPVCDACVRNMVPRVSEKDILSRQQQSEMMRERMSGLRAGGGAGSDPADQFGMRKPPQPVVSGDPAADHVLRDSEGRPLAVIGPGGGGQGVSGSYTPGAGGGGAGKWHPEPPRVVGQAGGGADAVPGPSIPDPVHGAPHPNPAPGPNGPRLAQQGPVQQAVPQTEVHTREFRPGGGNVVFVDTRDSEFLGPEKVEAGVPSLGSKICIGCRHEINDGTTSGVAEAWRWAMNPENGKERGHPECLARIGR